MKLFVATCTTFTDESRTTLLGVFSSREAVETVFSRVEVVETSEAPSFYGSWKRQHSCFQGRHEVVEVQLDEWTPLGI